jgi:EamA domain-containing membrane protein RarD
MTSAARHRRAILFMVIAAVCWSSGGILVRALSITNAWEIVFWRSLFMAMFVAGVLTVLHGRRMPRAVEEHNRPRCVDNVIYLLAIWCKWLDPFDWVHVRRMFEKLVHS